jgi:hypothetical protein
MTRRPSAQTAPTSALGADTARQVKRPAAVSSGPDRHWRRGRLRRPQDQRKAGGRGQAAELAVTSRTRQSTTVMSVAPAGLRCVGG